MQRSTFVPGIRPVTLLNIAVLESLSVRSTAAAVTWLVTLSFCATNAARDDVTTSRAMTMKERATAASWRASALSDRRPRRVAAPADWGAPMLMHCVSDFPQGSLSDYTQLTPGGDCARGCGTRPVVLRRSGPAVGDEPEPLARGRNLRR